MALAFGEVHSGLKSFEQSCHDAGACVGGTITGFSDRWLASLPASSQIGEYARDGLLGVPPGWTMSSPRRPQFKAGLRS